MAMFRWYRAWIPAPTDVASDYQPPAHILKRLIEKGMVEPMPHLTTDVETPVRYRLSDTGMNKVRHA